MTYAHTKSKRNACWLLTTYFLPCESLLVAYVILALSMHVAAKIASIWTLKQSNLNNLSLCSVCDQFFAVAICGADLHEQVQQEQIIAESCYTFVLYPVGCYAGIFLFSSFYNVGHCSAPAGWFECKVHALTLLLSYPWSSVIVACKARTPHTCMYTP